METPRRDPERRPRPDIPLGLGLFPGSAELAIWVLALLLAMLVVWISDSLGSADWLDFFKWTTAAYLISRGIAKASRVFEY